MKVLSLLQPWASLCVLTDPKTGKAYKQIETRSWNTNYRGELLIHASAGKSANNRSIQLDFQQQFSGLCLPKYESLPFGAIIGKVTLVDTHKTDNCEAPSFLPASKIIKPWEEERSGDSYLALTEQEFAFGDYSPGRYGWLLSDPVFFDKPIPAKGKLGLWEFDVQYL